MIQVKYILSFICAFIYIPNRPTPEQKTVLSFFSSLVIPQNIVLASDPCSRSLDGYKVKMKGKNCQNHTVKEEMHGQLCKNRKK